MGKALSGFKDISTLVFDVDGVLTDSNLLVTEEGHLLRKMNVRDGYAIRKAVDSGLRVAIITGGKSEGVIKRLKGLGVTDIYAGIQRKMEAFESLLDKYSIDLADVLYMGDDIPDYKVMRQVSMPVCPRNAAPEILAISQYISPYNGGSGCVRDVIEKVLKLNGKWI